MPICKGCRDYIYSDAKECPRCKRRNIVPSELGEATNFQTNLIGKKCQYGKQEIVGIFRMKCLGGWDWKIMLLDLHSGKIAEIYLASNELIIDVP